MMEEGIKYHTGDVDKILDTPIFLKSDLHNGIQLVDSIAYLLNRYARKVLERKETSIFDSLSEYFLFILSPLFYQGVPKNNSSQGIKFFPNNGPSEFYNPFKEQV